MLSIGLILAAALAAQGAEPAKPDAAPPAAQASTAAKPAAKPAEPKKICVTEAQMGSHMKKRICATQEEWDRRQANDAREMSKMRDNAGSCTGSAC